jgi:hypothetical protein
MSTVYLNEFGISSPFIAKKDLESFMVRTALSANINAGFTAKS